VCNLAPVEAIRLGKNVRVVRVTVKCVIKLSVYNAVKT